MAYAAVISLKHTIQRLENSINIPQLTKYQELNSLRSMLKELDKESSRSIDRRVRKKRNIMAYAAVISLKHIMERLENPINKPQITKSVYQELNSLRSMLEELDKESSRSIDRRVINEVDAKIREAVWKVENVLESYYSLIPPSQGLDEKGVEEEMNSFLRTVKMLREEYYSVLQNPLPAEEDEVLSATIPPVNKSTTVGLSDLSHKIINQLVFGIGKTHQLATQIYQIYDLSNKIIPIHLLGFLRVPQSDPHFVSLVGMAGIGKTHLAALIYHHPRILQHFHVRLWVRAGPKYQLNIIFADILAQLLHKPRDLFKEESVDTLIHLLGNSLGGRRYLIVLDDIWTTQVFDYISLLHFVDHRMDSRKDSRFLITTRLQEVAKYRSSRNTIHQMPFLNNEESWSLLWQNVFVAEKYFPSQLEKAGRKIAEKCEGLPLLILAVANILRGLDKTEEYWMKVADQKTTTFTDAYDQIYEVLLPSYDYLPQLLKACFLYMGVFPQTCEIPLSKLINLWAVEDFLEPTLYHLYPHLPRFDDEEEGQHQMLQKIAIECMNDRVSRSLAIECMNDLVSRSRAIERMNDRVSRSLAIECMNDLVSRRLAIECMDDLVSRSLAIVCKRSFRRVRKIKSSKLHAAYCYLCITEARKNKLFHVLNKLTDVYIERPRRLAVQNHILLGLKEVNKSMAAITSTTRSLLCSGEDHQYPVRICLNIMLLMRVLDALAIRFYEFPNEVLNLLQLRYLSLTHNGELPSAINKLQRLQCLILCRHHNIKFPTAPRTCLPEEIWDMQELRHLRIKGSNLPYPSYGTMLPKLLTLHVNADSCTRAVFRSIPNLKKLGISIELEPDAAAQTVRCFTHTRLLKGLESLKCVVVNPRLHSQLVVVPPYHLSNLPRGLKKLSLNGLGYPWKYMTAIGSLRKLEVLKLRCSAFQGPHWETKAARQFPSLIYLLLEDIDLVHWTAEYKCFRSLRHLSVRHCYKLKKIPEEMGDIRSLEMMEVDDCSPSVVDSVQQLKLKTKYSHLQVVINSSWNL